MTMPLYARALARELASEHDDSITARLDAVYADADSSIEPELRSAQRRILAEW